MPPHTPLFAALLLSSGPTILFRLIQLHVFVTALLPDQIPHQQRSGPAALNGMAPIVGGVLGLVLVTRLTAPTQVWQGYVLLALVSAACIGLFLLVLREQPISRQDVPPFAWRTFLAGFVQPLGSRDFACTLLSRALVFLSFTLLGSYLFFYVNQGLRLPLAAAAQVVITFQVLSTASLSLVALLAGTLAQRFQRLKPCIITGALVILAAGRSSHLARVAGGCRPLWGWLWRGARRRYCRRDPCLAPRG